MKKSMIDENDPLTKLALEKRKAKHKAMLEMQNTSDLLNKRPNNTITPEQIRDYFEKYEAKWGQYPTCVKAVEYFTPPEYWEQFKKHDNRL